MSYKHISGWVDVTEPSGPSGPIDPGWGVTPPTDPGYGRPGWSPADPGYDRPSWGGRPDQGLPPEGGHIWGALIRWLQRPTIDGGPAKPPGLRPVVPPRPDTKPPNGGRPPHPWRPGHWEPIDPGFGKPPVWGWVPSIDNGLPEPPVGPGPTPPPTGPGSGGGGWLPTDPDFGKPIRPCPPVGGKPHPPIWAWIPDRPEVEPPEGSGGTVTVYPTEATVLASGGSGSFNVTLSTPGMTWQVGPTPEWVTCTPTGPQTADVNVVYSATQNTTGAPRQALIDVNGTKFTLNQGAV